MRMRQKDIIEIVQKTIIFLGFILIMLIIIREGIKNYYIQRSHNNFIEAFSEEYELQDNEEDEYIFTMMNRMVDIFSVELNGYEIKVSDKSYGYVENIEDRDEILEEVCLNYIDNLGVEPEDVIKIEVNGELEATPYKVKVSELVDIGEISQQIYQTAVINDAVLNMEVDVVNKIEEEIEAPIIEEESEELYMGQTTETEGENGKKIIYKKITYEGLELTEESIIDELVTVQPVATVIKKGVKNPYLDGVAFLTNPAKNGYLSSVFGEQRDSSYHKGIDIAKNLGEDVNCACDGIVTYASYNDGGYGNLIIVEHNNDMETYYAHLSEIYVSVGDLVKTDEVIGAVGSTGYSTGPHLHFELRIGGVPVNPLDYIIS